MEEAFIKWNFRADLWAASTAMAMFAAYVALDLARGVSSRHRFTVWRSLVASALALAGGTWAAHFIVIAGNPLPFDLGYHAGITLGALMLALVTSIAGVHLGARPHLTAGRIVLAAFILGTGACGVPLLNLRALDFAPAPQWNLLLIAGGWAGACLCAGASLSIVAVNRRRVSHLGLSW